MKNRLLHQIFAIVLSATAVASPMKPIQRIAFGSCIDQDVAQPIWNSVAGIKPDLFILLGDNVYGDTQDMTLLRAKYQKFDQKPEFMSFRSLFPILATWDDHDYGVNDSSKEYPKKRESQKVFLDFMREPNDSARRNQEGIYSSYLFGTAPKRVQVILLDTRYHRDSLTLSKDGSIYLPDPDPTKTFLGPTQWEWLKRELEKPAEIRIIGSSIQVLSNQHCCEKWANLPVERQRLLDLVAGVAFGTPVFISGDMHFGEISRLNDRRHPNPIYDITGSGMTHFDKEAETLYVNPYRVQIYVGLNFGSIEIDWNSGMKLTFNLHDETGKVRRHEEVLVGQRTGRGD